MKTTKPAIPVTPRQELLTKVDSVGGELQIQEQIFRFGVKVPTSQTAILYKEIVTKGTRVIAIHPCYKDLVELQIDPDNYLFIVELVEWEKRYERRS